MSKRKWVFKLPSNESSRFVEPYGLVAAPEFTQHAKDKSRNDQKLKMKKAWELARSPLQTLPFFMLLIWLVPNVLSIYTITFAVMAVTPLVQSLNVNTVFAPLQDASNANSLILCKIVYVLINIVILCIGLWKVVKLGLLPVNDADWLPFYGVKQAVEITGGGLAEY